MNIEITLTLGQLIAVLLGAAGFVLLIYLVVAVSKLIPVFKNLNTTLVDLNKVLENADKVVDDAKVISSIAANKAEKADKLVDDASSVLSNVSSSLKGNMNAISAASSLVNSVGAIRSLFSSDHSRGRRKK